MRASCRSPPCNDLRTFPRRSSARSASSCSPASPPSRRSNAFSRASSCCWWWTTASTCWGRRRSSAACWASCPGVDRARDQPRAARLARRGALPGPAARRSWKRQSGEPERRRTGTPSRCSRERARAHDPEFELSDGNDAAVAEICRRVDGLPLAIELAAARCELLSPAEIAERLETALGALGAGARDAPARQQTLRATIDWSHELLTEDEQGLLRAVRRVRRRRDGRRRRRRSPAPTSTRSTASSPRACSCAAGSADGHTRLTMLETIRAYAGERFAAAADADAVRERHYRHFLALAQRHGSERALWGTSRKEHLAKLDADIDNLHVALGWAVRQATAEPALAMCAALGTLLADREIATRRRSTGSIGHWICRAPTPTRRRASARSASRPGPCGRSGAEPSNLPSWPRRRPAQGRWRTRRSSRRCSRPARPKRPATAATGMSPRRSRTRRFDWARVAGDRWRIAMAAKSQSHGPRERRGASPARRPGRLAARARSATCTTSRTCSPAPPTPPCATAAIVTRASSSAVRSRSHRDSTIPTSGCCCAATMRSPRCSPTTSTRAREAFSEELTLCRELVVRPFASEGLAGLAATATVHDDLDRAARLYGAAGSHRYGEPEDRVTERLHTIYFEPARTRHGADAWDNAVARGRGAQLRGRNRLRPQRATRAHASGEDATRVARRTCPLTGPAAHEDVRKPLR